MSLRGNEATGAISQRIDNPEIATLSRQGRIARNDKKGVAIQSTKWEELYYSSAFDSTYNSFMLHGELLEFS
jgi:hypothetical protein